MYIFDKIEKKSFLVHFGCSNIIYIFHTSKKNIKKRDVHFSPIWKNVKKIHEGVEGMPNLYFAKLPAFQNLDSLRWNINLTNLRKAICMSNISNNLEIVSH